MNNSSSREGWPSTQGPAVANTPQNSAESQAPRPLGAFGVGGASSQQQTPQQAAQPPTQAGGTVLPPPSGTFFSPSHSAAHNFPPLANLGQTGQTSPNHRPQAPVQDAVTAQHPPTQQVGGYSLPAISQSAPPQPQNQPSANPDHDRDTRDVRDPEMIDRHMEDIAAREAEPKERETRDRQQRELGNALEHHTGSVHLHQPVAVAPNVRAMHAPNGLLGNPGPMVGPNQGPASLGAPAEPANVFGGGPVQQAEVAARMQQAGQQPQQALMMQFATAPGAQQQNPMGTAAGQQPILNIALDAQDALSYLDQVKVQFSDHPDVYNRFLDIMKDFKSGAIDTPGVISRVSGLFAGNPNLIQGFNTFLPPGYKIECGASDDPNTIRVTTPMGTTVEHLPAQRPLSPRENAVNGNNIAATERSYHDGPPRSVSGSWQQISSSAGQNALFSPGGHAVVQPPFGHVAAQNSQTSLSPEALAQRDQNAAVANAAAMAHQQEQRAVTQLQNAASAATTGAIPRQGLVSPSAGTTALPPGQGMNSMGASMPQSVPGAGIEKRGPVEFNHAISYVNKIKNRFSSQPDIYKQFLEILQTYQRESKPIQDVYAQVTRLFETAPDLLEDFKQFLPESAAQAKAAAARAAAAKDAFMLSNTRNEPGYAAAAQAHQIHHTPRADQPRLPPVGNFAPTPVASRDNKRKRGDRQGAAASSSVMGAMGSETNNGMARNGYGQPGMNRRTKQQHGAKQAVIAEGPPVSPTLVPQLPEPLPPSTTFAATSDELAFFDRAKKFIGNKNTMNEFLKLCNLFVQDLIDKPTLVHRAQSFIGGNPELMNWFKKFVDYEPKEEFIENRLRPVSGRVSLSNCRGLGPSYRLLPKRERQAICSGRDELCRNVLNDEWASHPTWASEDSGFVAHRKNIHEEGLHRIEEERHDYDFNIEAAARTIQLLEPIAQSLRLKSNEERARFVLPAGLGGQSETIYKRVIMKIYGRDKGKQVIDALFTQPHNVIPVLLPRLKAVVEGWKAAQREWEKVWREQTQKMFWKSLDHQSIGAKLADKRQFQTKTLQNEIIVKYEEQRLQRERQQIAVPRYQFAYTFDDTDVLLDASQLVLTYAEHVHSTDYPRLIGFIKEFVPLFFGLDPASFDNRVRTNTNGSPQLEDMDDETPGPEDSFSVRAQKTNGKKTTLLRTALDRGRSGKPGRKDKEDSVASGSRGSTPELGSAVDEDMTGMDTPNGDTTNAEPITERWLDHPVKGNPFKQRDIAPNEPYKRTIYHMYCNLPIYCFFRMFVIFYERLLSLKRSESDVHETVRRAQAPKPARDLRMIDKFPHDFFSDTSSTANYYSQILTMFEDQIKGEMDMSHIEETLRRFYLQSGWQLYSFDRLLGALVRFAIAMFGNDGRDKTWDIYQLFRRDRMREETTHQDELNYRKQVEKHIKEGDMYRISFNQPAMKAYVQIFKKDDPTYNPSTLDIERRWRYYTNSYTTIDPTEGVQYQHVHMPLLKRNNEALEDDGDKANAVARQTRSDEKLVIRIGVENYSLVFNKPGEEHLARSEIARSGGQHGHAESERMHEKRTGESQEKIVMNNVWMKDLSKDAVDARKQKFARDVADVEGQEGSNTGPEQEDEEMTVE